MVAFRRPAILVGVGPKPRSGTFLINDLCAPTSVVRCSIAIVQIGLKADVIACSGIFWLLAPSRRSSCTTGRSARLLRADLEEPDLQNFRSTAGTGPDAAVGGWADHDPELTPRSLTSKVFEGWTAVVRAQISLGLQRQGSGCRVCLPIYQGCLRLPDWVYAEAAFDSGHIRPTLVPVPAPISAEAQQPQSSRLNMGRWSTRTTRSVWIHERDV
jgi:hypothetical protein